MIVNASIEDQQTPVVLVRNAASSEFVCDQLEGKAGMPVKVVPDENGYRLELPELRAWKAFLVRCI